ncbi:hypothetical protein E2C01_011535 [Portunus trituberculatus]|uniref:Uncharacterized protein n=1 Tax=Portunus trituberculatus TaxID=210409 RepID=A0A5B7DC83_PORTR|nr:hypothetical protein [Portunus trituberculatus]
MKHLPVIHDLLRRHPNLLPCDVHSAGGTHHFGTPGSYVHPHGMPVVHMSSSWGCPCHHNHLHPYHCQHCPGPPYHQQSLEKDRQNVCHLKLWSVTPQCFSSASCSNSFMVVSTVRGSSTRPATTMALLKSCG